MKFQEVKTIQKRLEIMEELSRKFLTRAAGKHEEGQFPYENIKDLKEAGYTSLTIPKRNGGEGLSLYEFIRLQEKMAEGDGSTALSIGWHMGIMKSLGEKNSWKESIYKNLCEKVKNGALMNNCATEPQTGSPTRGGKPVTSAVRDGHNWVLNGRKTFTTMAPVLDYFNVSATIADNGQIGNFLIPRTAEGVEIEETWDSIAMRGTGSHDLILKNARVKEEALVEIFEPGQKGAAGWLLHIPACYLGIAQAAQTYAIDFAKKYSPNSINGAIIDLPNVQQKIGEMELELMRARHFLYSVAKQWDEADELARSIMQPELGAVKFAVTNAAISVVDLAMRVVGARSLSEKNPLQRYYRDVRAGLHNPPMDDMTIQVLAKHAIE
ncbi:acyl-CoA dehydrogenase family protein [Cytobacillus sp. NCCP-133]|uniref:acyl-CoA dehydrogenase family protein n=1 Tax=Cytobacillus sp. NCCP-133 TaxID=766848 RepID=UPI00223171D6|nr:acyl-CoA dehydrogenase family protein [Cytobacillus sp. NCCP-133]GLB59921.1 acyl-CoA dehydrogenase [Cytobacillus sp. NCCP-133]